MPYKFEPKATKLDTKGLVREKTANGEEITREVQLYAIEILVPNTQNTYSIRIVKEEDYPSFLNIKNQQGLSEEAKYEIVKETTKGLGTMVLVVKGATGDEPSHIELDNIVNDTRRSKNPYTHIGIAGQEFALRFAHEQGVEGRIKLEASSELGGEGPHLAYQAFGFEPGNYYDTPQLLAIKKEKWNTQLAAARAKAEEKGGRINTTSMDDTIMFIPPEVIAQKYKLYGIGTPAASASVTDKKDKESKPQPIATRNEIWASADKKQIKLIKAYTASFIEDAKTTIAKLQTALGPTNQSVIKLNLSFQTHGPNQHIALIHEAFIDVVSETKQDNPAHKEVSAFLDRHSQSMKYYNFLSDALSTIEQIEAASGSKADQLRTAFATTHTTEISKSFAKEILAGKDKSGLASAFLEREKSMFMDDAEAALERIEKKQKWSTKQARKDAVTMIRELIKKNPPNPVEIYRAFQQEATKADANTGFWGKAGGKSSFRDEANIFLARSSSYIDYLRWERAEIQKNKLTSEEKAIVEGYNGKYRQSSIGQHENFNFENIALALSKSTGQEFKNHVKAWLLEDFSNPKNDRSQFISQSLLYSLILSKDFPLNKLGLNKSEKQQLLANLREPLRDAAFNVPILESMAKKIGNETYKGAWKKFMEFFMGCNNFATVHNQITQMHKATIVASETPAPTTYRMC